MAAVPPLYVSHAFYDCTTCAKETEGFTIRLRLYVAKEIATVRN